jgi:hypothetical protein
MDIGWDWAGVMPVMGWHEGSRIGVEIFGLLDVLTVLIRIRKTHKKSLKG